ncbi:hypothetical protein KUTeg_020728 [Tegillarca granosa]|uniref:ATP-dependent RNA helicase DHX36 n=1 Tax=Tegillarca granosa TaxID=220873 RepID=A0ABQ9EBH7_TEGGR|nr:hypothetical protein KUTeg_020728 [Tegillarca granosa]
MAKSFHFSRQICYLATKPNIIQYKVKKIDTLSTCTRCKCYIRSGHGKYFLDNQHTEIVNKKAMSNYSRRDDEGHGRGHSRHHGNSHSNRNERFDGSPEFDRRSHFTWEIVNTVNSNQVTVISGETGCGKTTQKKLLQIMLCKCEFFRINVFSSYNKIICTLSSLDHILYCKKKKYHSSFWMIIFRKTLVLMFDYGVFVHVFILLLNALPVREMKRLVTMALKLPRKHGSILFCTTGILLKYLEVDPLLKHTTHIVLDEIHERDLLSDFLMIILKDILPVRPNLKIILMSATLRSEQFSAYFNNCPMLNIPGFTYPVTEYLLEDVIEMTGYMPTQTNIKQNRYPKWKRERKEERDEQQWNLEAWSRSLAGKYSTRTIQALQNINNDQVDCDLIVSLIRHISLKLEEGAILVFVPGWSEISKINKMLLDDKMFNSDKFLVLPLHSQMPTINQKQVFDTPPPGVRKIIIATNIAETSITINDVVHVIDCGKIKAKDYIPELNLTTLDIQTVSKANARQRRGRAGRVKSGKCFHLYSSLQEMELRDFLPPEILRTRLEELCLKVKILKLGKVKPFVDKAMEKPSSEALEKAIVNLQELKALDSDENLLPLGYHLARMPVDPHSGKMLLFGAMFGCLDPICTVAASLSFKDAFVKPLGREEEVDRAKCELAQNYRSDHIMLVNAFDGWERAVSRGTDKQYCWDYFLSSITLKLLRDMKKQFAEYLYDIGFVKSKDPKDSAVNMNSNNPEIVKAVMCAGLYPNVAKIGKVPRTQYKTPALFLKDNSIRKTYIHPTSVNARVKEFESQWMIYHKLMKTSVTFVFNTTMIFVFKTTVTYVFDTTMVSPYPLLFFGGNITTELDTSHSELRQKLDEILESKITNPSLTNWSLKSKEGYINLSYALLIEVLYLQILKQYLQRMSMLLHKS